MPSRLIPVLWCAVTCIFVPDEMHYSRRRRHCVHIWMECVCVCCRVYDVVEQHNPNRHELLDATLHSTPRPHRKKNTRFIFFVGCDSKRVSLLDRAAVCSVVICGYDLWLGKRFWVHRNEIYGNYMFVSCPSRNTNRSRTWSRLLVAHNEETISPTWRQYHICVRACALDEHVHICELNWNQMNLRLDARRLQSLPTSINQRMNCSRGTCVNVFKNVRYVAMIDDQRWLSGQIENWFDNCWKMHAGVS